MAVCKCNYVKEKIAPTRNSAVSMCQHACAEFKSDACESSCTVRPRV